MSKISSPIRLADWTSWPLGILALLALFFSLLRAEIPTHASLILSVIVLMASLGLNKIIISSNNKWLVVHHLLWPTLLLWYALHRDAGLATAQSITSSLFIVVAIVVLVQLSYGFQSPVLQLVTHFAFLFASFFLIGLIAFGEAFDLSADQNTKRSALLMIEIPLFYLVYLFANDHMKQDRFSDWRKEMIYALKLLILCAPIFFLLGFI